MSTPTKKRIVNLGRLQPEGSKYAYLVTYDRETGYLTFRRLWSRTQPLVVRLEKVHNLFDGRLL